MKAVVWNFKNIDPNESIKSTSIPSRVRFKNYHCRLKKQISREMLECFDNCFYSWTFLNAFCATLFQHLPVGGYPLSTVYGSGNGLNLKPPHKANALGGVALSSEKCWLKTLSQTQPDQFFFLEIKKILDKMKMNSSRGSYSVILYREVRKVLHFLKGGMS